jgi:hypothetical protein
MPRAPPVTSATFPDSEYVGMAPVSHRRLRAVVHIWVRATLDYDDERAFESQLRDRFREQVARWDSLFEMPFRVFRSRVRAIARANLARVEDAVVCEWDAIPAGAIVLPCDDDDWFRPDAARVIEHALAGGAPGVRWTSSFLEVPTDWRHALGIHRARLLGPRPEFLCTTNNYALRTPPASQLELENHLAASRWVRERADGGVPVLDERLSLMNRTLGSQTSLGHLGAARSRRAVLRKLPRYRRLYERTLPRELGWAQPHVDQMRELMRELERRS